MRVRATVFFLSVVVILALTSQGVPVAQQDTPGQDTPGQAPAGRGGGGGRGGERHARRRKGITFRRFGRRRISPA